MTNRVVVACFGDDQSRDLIEQLARTAEVIAVALDCSGAVSLAAIREMALAAGATRCHALDVREEFAREMLLPAIRARAGVDPMAIVAALAPEFAARKLDEIGVLERAAVVRPDSANVQSRPLQRPVAEPQVLEIAFADGVPVSVNGVHMPLTELIESIETITGEPAMDVLNREMTKCPEPQTA